MGDIAKTILKTALTGLGALALAVLVILFASMSRQGLLLLALFILIVVLGAYVVWLVKRVDYLEEQLDKLLEAQQKED